VDLGPTFLDLATRQSKKSSMLLQSSYPMDGKSIVPLLTGQLPPAPVTNHFRWAALLEMYGGTSNIGLRYKGMKNYYQNHMFPNTYQAVRVVHGPDWASQADWLYVEWCTGEQECYNMTNDPHQVHNLVVPFTAEKNIDLQLLHRLSQLLARLGDCTGAECHELRLDYSSLDTVISRKLSLTPLQESIRNRIPCFNPSNWTNVDTTLRRKPFAVDLPVPDPFAFGFPFSDGDIVPDDLLKIWEEYEHYFY
jgi:hypothetical protein